MSSVQHVTPDKDEGAPAKRRKRWWRFSLRTMFGVVTLLCVYLGRLQYRVHREFFALNALAQRGYRFQYSDNAGSFEEEVRRTDAFSGTYLGLVPARLSREWANFGMVVSAEPSTQSRAEDVPLLLEITCLQGATVSGSSIRDDDLKRLLSARRLRGICIDDCAVTDASVDFLKSHHELRTVRFRGVALSQRVQYELMQALPNCEVIVEPSSLKREMR